MMEILPLSPLEMKKLRHSEVKSPNKWEKLRWPQDSDGDPRTERWFVTL